MWSHLRMMEHVGVRKGALKGGREAFKVDEEALSDDGEVVNSDGDAVKSGWEGLDGDKKAL